MSLKATDVIAGGETSGNVRHIDPSLKGTHMTWVGDPFRVGSIVTSDPWVSSTAIIFVPFRDGGIRSLRLPVLTCDLHF